MHEIQISTLQMTRDIVAMGWTKGRSAQDADGNGVLSTDETAVRWCLTGAAVKAWDSLGRPDEGRFDVALLGFGDWPSAIRWNDRPERTKAEVLQRIDEAIAKLQVA